jgi:hypothetical protein
LIFAAVVAAPLVALVAAVSANTTNSTFFSFHHHGDLKPAPCIGI